MTGYTIVDLETTGLFPQQHDRVLEIGLINVSDAGEVESEWATLINPQRDVGPTHIHGITARDILDAPTFRDVVPHVIRSIAGTGTRPPTPSLCTMQLSSNYLRGASCKLKDCCDAARIAHVDPHTVLGDARAVVGLLRFYLTNAGSPVPWSTQR